MIYEKNNAQMRNLLVNFGKTNYGKCMFLICYTPFFVLFALTVFSVFLFLSCNCLQSCCMVILKLLFVTLISFCIGSYGYYKEIRVYSFNIKTKK